MQHAEIPSLFMTLLLIYHRGIQGCQYLSSDYDRLSSVQLHPYSVLCIAGGLHLAEDSPWSQPRLLWLCKHAPKKSRKWTERCGVVEKPMAFCLIDHLFRISVAVVICWWFRQHHVLSLDFITSRNAGWQARTSGAKAGRFDGGMRPYFARSRPFYTNFLPAISTVIWIESTFIMGRSWINFRSQKNVFGPILNESEESVQRYV